MLLYRAKQPQSEGTEEERELISLGSRNTGSLK
jgi:hypothetical protein